MRSPTGADPTRLPCPRCGRPAGGWASGKFWQVARHMAPDGKWCRRVERKPGGAVSVPVAGVELAVDQVRTAKAVKRG